MPGPRTRPGAGNNNPPAAKPKPSGGSSKPAGGYSPHAERGWTRLNGTLATTLPSALRTARLLRKAAWRVS